MENYRRPPRKRTKQEIFKQDQLPFIIAGVTVILVLIFIIGSICMAVARGRANKRLARQEAAKQAQHELWQKEQHEVAAEADELMAKLDYEGALAVLEAFEGDSKKYTEIGDRLEVCRDTLSSMVVWNDPGKVVNLSFQMLVADTQRAFNYPLYGNSINRNYITVEEFGRILQQMYDNGYVLVNQQDIVEAKTAEDGTVRYEAKELKLPAGKKPMMLTQTNVNYNLYLVDSDEDGEPDKNGAGFAARLALDENGKFISEMVNAEGEWVKGDYDLVPILEKFIESHPGFSYKDARAIIALTGYNGLFGYRTQEGKDVEQAKKIAEELRNTGYTLACYTYSNAGVVSLVSGGLRLEMDHWEEEVTPILGKLDTFVFAQNEDLSDSGAYSGDRFQLLHDLGYRYFVGFCKYGTPWAASYSDYFRQGRIMVSNANMKSHADWFEGLFDPDTVLDGNRPTYW